MATVTMYLNPCDLKEFVKHDVDAGVALIDFFVLHYPNGFGAPIHVWCNHQRIFHDAWDLVVEPDDRVAVYVMPQNPWVVVASIAINYFLTKELISDLKPPPFLEQPEPNPVYSLRAQQNTSRLGEPIPVVYGDVIQTPDLIAPSYTAYTKATKTTNNVPAEPYQLTPNDGTAPFVANEWAMVWLKYADGRLRIHDLVFVQPGYADIYRGLLANYTNGTTGSIPSTSIAGVVGYEIRSWDPYGGGSFDTATGFYTPPATGETLYGSFNTQGATIGTQGSTTEVYVLPASDAQDEYLFMNMCLGMETVVDKKLLIGDVDAAQLSSGVATWKTQTANGHRQGALENAMNTGIVANQPAFWEFPVPAFSLANFEMNKDGTQSGWFPIGRTIPVSEVLVNIRFPRGYFRTDNTKITTILNVSLRNQDNTADTITRQLNIESGPVFNDQTPRRVSFLLSVPPKKYSVNITRVSTTNAPPVNQGMADITAVSIVGNGVHVPQNVYNNSTVLGLKIKANEITSQNTGNRIRVMCERKTGTAQRPKTIREVVEDMFTNTVYGAGQSINEIDSAYLSSLNTFWNSQRFNGIYNQASTVYEAISQPLSLVAAKPIFVDGQLSFTADGKKPVRSALFNASNMLSNSLTIDYRFKRVGETDGITIEFNDPDTWSLHQVTYPSNAVDPRVVRLFGCTNATYALGMATYMHQKSLQIVKSLRFETEYDGLVLRVGDRIGLQHEMPKWGQGGRILSVDTTANTITVDQNLDWTGAAHQLMLRLEHGQASNPLTVTQGATPNVINFTPPLPITTGDLSDYDASWLYAFGETNQLVTDWLVTSIEPNGETVSVSCVNYDESIYTNGLPFMGGNVP